MAKVRMTAFSRFLLALLIIVPLSFVASYYINGQQPINWKKIVNLDFLDTKAKEATDVAQETETEDNPVTIDMNNEQLQALQDSISHLNQTITQQDSQINALEQKLDLVNYLQGQLDSLNGKPITTVDSIITEQ